MNRLPRAPTSGEKTKMRTDEQWSRQYLIIDNPLSDDVPAVYTARVNGTPSTTDQVAEFQYDGGSGTLANVLVGMTLWLGSSAGDYDKGQARIRALPDADTFFIGEESEIDIADNDYVTIVDDFSPGGFWAKHAKMDGATTEMDYNVSYSNQHSNRNPVPVLGTDAIAELVGNTVTVGFDATDSWVPGGGTNSYSWSAPGASATSGLTTATPTFTYNAAGRYRVSCAVTINGVEFTGYRYVYVHDKNNPPITDFTLENPEGSVDDGGWSFAVTLYGSDADRSLVRDRAKVILFSKDYYRSEQVSLGYLEGRENIQCMGWIAGETILWSPEQSSVTFEIKGPQYWLGKINAFPIMLDHTNATPAAWTEYNGLTVDAALWHLLMWRTTAPLCMDCRVETDTRLAKSLEAPATNLWEQIKVFCKQTILANVYCDRWGRFFEEVEPQYKDDRSAIVEVMELTTVDFMRDVEFQRIVVSPVCQVNASGIYFDGTTALSYCAVSPGVIFKRYGEPHTQDRLLISGSAQVVTLAGLMLGRLNNEYPRITLKLAANNPFFDIAPAMYATLTLNSDDTPRGISFTLKRLIPRRIRLVFNHQTGALMPEIDFEPETFAEIAIATNCLAEAPELTGSTAPAGPPVTGTGSGASGDSVWEITYNP
jgi:hypothetical protein